MMVFVIIDRSRTRDLILGVRALYHCANALTLHTLCRSLISLARADRAEQMESRELMNHQACMRERMVYDTFVRSCKWTFAHSWCASGENSVRKWTVRYVP